MVNLKSEVTFWLKSVLPEDIISDFTVEIEGNSEKGEGFMGDILFVNLTKQSNPPKELNLALKSSKRSETVRAKTPIQQTFKHEIYIYDTVCATFTKFQQEKGFPETEMFNCMPKFYGSFTGDNVEVLVFENLKKRGFEMWDKKNPVTTKHLEIVLEEYGKWHALSAALRDQKPEKFKQLTDGLDSTWRQFCKATDMTSMFKKNAEEALNLLKNELNETTMKEWLELIPHITEIMSETPGNSDNFSVIVHGDCWNNNFMYKIDENIDEPLGVAIVDWQMASFSSPVLDLSNFIYCCASQEDLDNLEELLKKYYSSFSGFAKKLGTDVEQLFPFSQLLSDWEKVAKYGMALSITAAKFAFVNKEDTLDLSETMENGLEVSDAFLTQLKDPSGFKNRARYLIEHAVKWRITKPNFGASSKDK